MVVHLLVVKLLPNLMSQIEYSLSNLAYLYYIYFFHLKEIQN